MPPSLHGGIRDIPDCSRPARMRTLTPMNKGTIGEARVHVDQTPEAVYDMVADVTRMGEWSPETIKCVWIDGATGPASGARFKGTNKRGFIRWSTKPEVIAADRGREFTFVTHTAGPSTKWSYRF